MPEPAPFRGFGSGSILEKQAPAPTPIFGLVFDTGTACKK